MGPEPRARVAVSVIIAAYEAERTLGDQLAALAAQVGAPPFEVIVGDNGSSDRTAQVARDHSSVLPALRVIDASARRGPAAARNAAAAHAAGRALAFCDADDVVSEEWLARLAHGLRDADAVAGGFEHESLNASRAPRVSWRTDVPIRLASWPLLPAGASSNLAVRADVFRSLDGFDEELLTCEDIDLCWRLQLAGYSLAFDPDAVVHERKRTGVRATYRQSVTYARGTRALEHKHRALLGSPVPTARSMPSLPVAPAGADEPASGAPGPPSAAKGSGTLGAPGRLRRLGARLARRDRCGLAADLAWRIGQRRGVPPGGRAR